MKQIETFDDIVTAWKQAEREAEKRAVWRALAREGWFRACRTAVQQSDSVTVEAWLEPDNATAQDIIEYTGVERAQLVHTHLLCSLAACDMRGLAVSEQMVSLLRREANAVSRGFCRDLIRALLGEPLYSAEKDISLNVLLVDTTRDEGVLTVLTLESVRDGSGELYPIPELAFMSSSDFQQVQYEACAWAETIGLWRTDRDVRWQLRRRDGKPLVNLTGPSMGAAFALGIVTLFATVSGG